MTIPTNDGGKAGAEKSLDANYKRIRQRLNRMANYEPEAKQPAHFYAQLIDRRFLGDIAFDALLLIDKMRELKVVS